jgi:hypothetical protein
MTHHSSSHRRTKTMAIKCDLNIDSKSKSHNATKNIKPNKFRNAANPTTTRYTTLKKPIWNTLSHPTTPHKKIIRMHWYAKDAIPGDTGANCSATNNISLLWNYQPLSKPIPIVTYQGQDKRSVNSFEAVGTGIIKMIVDDTTINWLTLYTPNSTGTIISPDRYMMVNGHIHEFLQSGPRNGKGHLQFINSDGKAVAKVKMKRQCNGLWYTDSPVLMPPPTLTNKLSVTDANLGSTPIVHKVNKLDMSHQTRQHPPKSEDTMPTNTTTAVRTTTWTAQASQALKQLELWHQRMGHPAPCTLQRTAQVVEGLPKIPSNFSHFHCPYCDIAKLAKTSGNPTSERETFIPGTAFHMDLGFICGPKMVKDNMGISRPSKTQTAQQSHDGYLAYLSSWTLQHFVSSASH